LERSGGTVPEPIFLRVRRLLSASVDDAVSAMERASGTSLMREAIRQVAEALDEVRAEQEAAAARIAQAKREQGLIRERIAELDDKARFALGKARDDLAEAAVSRQLDLEAQLARLDTVQAEAAAQAVRLDECAAALAVRKAQMERELAAFEAARRDGLGGDGANRRDQALQRRVDRAQETFERVMAETGGASAGRADPQEAEIDALRRDAALAERMEKLRAGAAKRSRARGAR
jgi:phage shock protein A